MATGKVIRKSMMNNHLNPGKLAFPSSVDKIAPCMIPLKSVPANPDEVKMAVRLPISDGLYQAPRIHCTPTNAEASKKACKHISSKTLDTR